LRNQINPDHYLNPPSALTIDILRNLTGKDPNNYQECRFLIDDHDSNCREYYTGCAIKYLWRCQKKTPDGVLIDLKKAVQCLNFAPPSAERLNAIDSITELIDRIQTEKLGVIRD
jgi:hypothetical protein